ncbi:membrane protein insertion efficiency factor YidD [Litoribrevibacter euphylliae]|uniref:Putative membrane protein insertion efficiency factor n=1 Tax=Litoribrevibacter euphylliae TaxID=1834034 RepID=A0ABV7HAI9_9GAMM
MANLKKPLVIIAKGLVRFYQVCISPFIGSHCRFYPSCSAYAMTAFETHGPIKGSWLAIRRISKCHPWNPGGFDYVPGTEPDQRESSESYGNTSDSSNCDNTNTLGVKVQGQARCSCHHR